MMCLKFMFLTIHTPVTVTSWESLLTHIPTDDREGVDLVRVLTEMEDPGVFLMVKPKRDVRALFG